MNIFLKAKHWHLFILNFAIPFFSYFIIIGITVSKLVSDQNPDPEIVFNYMPVFIIIGLLSYGVELGWIWSVAMGLRKKLPEELKMKANAFKLFFFFPLIYFPIFIIVFFNVFEAYNIDPIFFLFIVPLHFFAMFCMFYCMYFTARTLKTVEYQCKTNVSDYIAEMILIWFYPIGIWFLQPNINRIISSPEDDNISKQQYAN